MPASLVAVITNPGAEDLAVVEVWLFLFCSRRIVVGPATLSPVFHRAIALAYIAHINTLRGLVPNPDET